MRALSGAALGVRPTARATETRGRKPGSGVLCLALLGVTAGGVGHVAVQARKLEVARALAVEQSAQQELLDRVRHARILNGELKSRARIEKVAQEVLKMEPPQATALRRVMANGVVVSAPAAVPAKSPASAKPGGSP